MKKEFGATKNGEKASCYVLKNSKGMEAVVSDFGASLLKLYVPDKDGKTQDVVLGYETLEDYENGGDSLGATVGRVANRIGMAEFELNGKKYELTKNDNGKNTLHGGIDFYNKRMWDVKEEDDTHVVFALVSPDGDQGFPGEVKIEVSYTITEENELKIHYHAIPDQDTLLNMTNHSYFNLSGHASGTAWNAKVWIDADAFTETDAELIPTGTVVPVEGTPMDFRKEKVVEKEIGADYTPLKLAGGYDHNWVLNTNGDIAQLAAKLTSPESGITLEVYTNEPGVQVYTGNFLDGTVTGKKGIVYNQRASVCLETQHYPDSPNKADWPSVVVRPGEKYHSTCIYKFGAE